MQAIRAGDLYFLQSPFSSGMAKDAIGTAQIEKRLSYLLGTVSSRPAVVIRPPAWWDRYNTVTVIPAITKGSPAYVCKLSDRYGFETEASYPFVPHNPHTIPVSRLGKRIGSLTDDELAELLYAFEWIHNPLMQRDESCEVPAIYRDVFNKKTLPPSWTENRDARSDIRIGINPDLVLESDTNPELNGFNIGKAVGIFVDPATTMPTDDFIPTESVLPDSTHTKEEKQMNSKNTVPVEKNFPNSIFSSDDLWNVASRFTIDDKFYAGDCTVRDPAVLTASELDKIFRDELPYVRDEIIAVYRKMTPFDAFLLGPRLPLQTLADLLNMSRDEAHELKMLCNVMRDMGDVDYDIRLKNLNAPKKDEKPDVPVTNTNDSKIDLAAASARLSKIKPYLNSKSIMKIPSKYAQDFLDTPMFMVQRAWSGPQFKTNYQKAITHYTAMMKKGA